MQLSVVEGDKVDIKRDEFKDGVKKKDNITCCALITLVQNGQTDGQMTEQLQYPFGLKSAEG